MTLTNNSRISRRRLIGGAASAVAGAGIFTSSIPVLAEEYSAAGPFFVPAAGGRADSPWIIQGTTPINVKVSGKDVGGRYSIIEVNTPPGRGPELHIHKRQNEMFFLVSGSIGFQCGSERMVLHPGDSFMAPMGVPHAYVTLGSAPARILNTYDPAGEIEVFFPEYVRLLNVQGPPDTGQLAACYARHGMQVVGPPLAVAEFRNNG